MKVVKELIKQLTRVIPIGILFLFFSCDYNRSKAPDVSHIQAEVDIRRFENDLFSIDSNQLAAELRQLEEKYPEFSDIFFGEILGSKNPEIAPEGHERYVQGFITHPAVAALYDSCRLKFNDFSALQADFNQAFRYFRYYFPDREIPDIVTFLSEYSIGAFIYGEHSLAIGLDFFLGATHPYAINNPGNANFSAYLTRTFTQEHLVSKTLQPMLEDMLGPPYGNRMLDMMIYNGKKLYLLDLLLPNTPDSIKLEVTAAQTQWLSDNHLEMWAFLLNEKLLYSTDWASIRKYVEYAPHSPGMPKEAPGRTANWIGWQIVKAYMKAYPDTSPEKLLEMRDAQKILDLSRYKPKR